jgi:hypothetical protein
MKIPSWAYVIGIFMILFGGCDVISDMQTTIADSLFDMESSFTITNEWQTDSTYDTVYTEQDTTIQVIQDSVVYSDDDTYITEDDITNIATNALKISPYAHKWTIRLANVGIAVGLLYMVGGVFLMVRQRFSIKLAYFALAVSLLLAFTRIIVFALDPDQGLLSTTSMYFPIISIIIDGIFVAVIANADKTAYQYAD